MLPFCFLATGLEQLSARRQLVANYLDTMCNDPLCQMASPLNGKYMLNLAVMAAAVRQVGSCSNLIRDCHDQ